MHLPKIAIIEAELELFFREFRKFIVCVCVCVCDGLKNSMIWNTFPHSLRACSRGEQERDG